MNAEPDTYKDLERENLALRSELRKARSEATRWQNRFNTVTAQRASIHRIAVETQSFEWEAFAMSEHQAWALLKQAWNKHITQYGEDRVTMTWSEFKENVVRNGVLPIGCAFRDGEMLIGGGE